MNLILNTPPLNAYEQMALDESLVSLRPEEITLRFYRWTPGPAVTFGYAQAYKDVCRLAAARGITQYIVRRPTGGGVVFHEDDLTFSLIFPSFLRPVEIYEKFHAFVQANLAQTGHTETALEGPVAKEAYRPSSSTGASACFQNPVENDVLNQRGEKILGGALRRFGSMLLYQGSLQMPGVRENPRYKTALIAAVRQFFAQDLMPAAAKEAWLIQARELANTQYQTTAWQEKF